MILDGVSLVVFEAFEVSFIEFLAGFHEIPNAGSGAVNRSWSTISPPIPVKKIYKFNNIYILIYPGFIF